MCKALQKESEDRNQREIRMLSDHFKFTRFFKELKMKPHQLKQVVLKLGYKRLEGNNFLIHYGDVGDSLYIILQGSVSVWKP